jgi:hypothetical protein
MTIRCLPRAVLLVGSLVLSIMVRGAHAQSPSAPYVSACAACPGDLNNDQMVTVDELITAANAALNGCGQPWSSLLQTGQTQCDQGNGTLGTCPGLPAGQDGAVQAGVVLSYTDNGDGTISDNSSGLMWEKLSNDASIHNVNNTYTWSDAFTVKIAALNTTPCFAGRCDWRLPNRRELDSLVYSGAAVLTLAPSFATLCSEPCTVTTCSCAQGDYYWSSTSWQDNGTNAWAVNYQDGSVLPFDKTTPYYVRAVRGGLPPAASGSGS